MILFRPAGCEKCCNFGYRSRMCIHELMESTPEIKLLIKKRTKKQGNIRAIFIEALRKGRTSPKQDDIQKVIRGLTTSRSFVGSASVE